MPRYHLFNAGRPASSRHGALTRGRSCTHACTHTFTYIYMYIYIYISTVHACVRACVHACLRNASAVRDCRDGEGKEARQLSRCIAFLDLAETRLTERRDLWGEEDGETSGEDGGG